jgi:predicted AlkP superfamily pyrophosphatase or phosphodiesterase
MRSFVAPLRLLLPALLLLTLNAVAQPKKPLPTPPAPPKVATAAVSQVFPNRPKLVVGIVIDQMRADYLYRYYDKFGKGGFRRMMDEGFNARNNHYHYAATYTGPGHAAIYTGSAPALNGIVGNDFYDRRLGRMLYCAEDTTVSTVGNTGSAGRMSPRNLLVTTIGDQLKLATDGRAKVIGIALKDRGAILPAGHAADGAYWYDSKDGNFITSSFYRKDLPAWVQTFNDRKLSDQYLAQPWTASRSLDAYTASTTDNQPYENTLPGETSPVFPHSFVATAGGSKYEPLRTSPFGDELTKEFAIAALAGEQLGQDEVTDLLCVSFSSPDYIGHAFGTHAVETEDEYRRLDAHLADLFAKLDATVGKGQYVAFLSADHGAADAPGFSQSYRIPADVLPYTTIGNAAKAALEKAYGPGQWMLTYFNQQVYLNHALLAEKKISLTDAVEVVRVALLPIRGVINALNLNNLSAVALPELQLGSLRNVYHPNRSGDVYVLLQAGWFEGRAKGTTHGTNYAYDTHVPLLLYGWGIRPGQTLHRTQIADIAPTLAALLGILEPSGSIGNPIQEAVMK